MGLGLDLQGGAYFLLELDTEDLRKSWIEALADDARQNLRDEKVLFTSPSVVGNEVRVKIKREDQVEKAFARLKKLARPNFDLFSGTPDVEVVRDGKVIKLMPTETALNTRVTNAMGTAVEIFRNRIDPSGTREILIQRQGENRILLQVPGVSDKEAQEIWEQKINKPAVLTFQLVDQSMSVQEAQAGSPPPGSAIYKGADNSDEEGQYLLLQKRVIVSGADLVDAQQAFSQDSTRPVVSFRFNTSGAQRFAKVTRDNVNKPFAIVLDGEVISAPVIQEAILSGTGQISGRYTVESANNLAVLLRSGALPAKPKLVARQTVGATIGADAIKSGKQATLWAFFLVALFMVIGYGLFGAFS
ncbi:MAG: protein translocase subunit SecD, partial [Alphaproteobacteria bacterium]